MCIRDRQRTFDVAELPTAASNHWSDYPLGVVSILAEMGNTIPGFSLSLWGDVPLGSGLSSSASVEVATALAVMSLIGVTYPGPVLARLCQRAENEFVGANCGIMDPVSYTHLDVYKRQDEARARGLAGPHLGEADRELRRGDGKICLLYTSRCV